MRITRVEEPKEPSEAHAGSLVGVGSGDGDGTNVSDFPVYIILMAPRFGP
jgi:hypothetical protein